MRDNVKPLAVDPFDASTLYGTNAGRCFSSALLRSRDGGATWETVGPAGPVSALWLDPDREGHAVVAVQSSGAAPDVLETADAFATWSPLGSA